MGLGQPPGRCAWPGLRRRQGCSAELRRLRAGAGGGRSDAWAAAGRDHGSATCSRAAARQRTSARCRRPRRASWSRCCPTYAPGRGGTRRLQRRPTLTAEALHRWRRKVGARPRVLIPVFPGTNCEYDTARAPWSGRARSRRYFVISNLTPGGRGRERGPRGGGASRAAR